MRFLEGRSIYQLLRVCVSADREQSLQHLIQTVARCRVQPCSTPVSWSLTTLLRTQRKCFTVRTNFAVDSTLRFRLRLKHNFYATHSSILQLESGARCVGRSCLRHGFIFLDRFFEFAQLALSSSPENVGRYRAHKIYQVSGGFVKEGCDPPVA